MDRSDLCQMTPEQLARASRAEVWGALLVEHRLRHNRTVSATMFWCLLTLTFLGIQAWTHGLDVWSYAYAGSSLLLAWSWQRAAAKRQRCEDAWDALIRVWSGDDTAG